MDKPKHASFSHKLATTTQPEDCPPAQSAGCPVLSDAEISQLEAIRAACEKRVGRIESITRIPNSRNYVYRISTSDRNYIYKSYDVQRRGSSTTEIWTYSQLSGLKYIKRCFYQHIGTPNNFIITEYKEGKELADLATEVQDPMTLNFLALQVVTLIKSSAQINTQRYGRFWQNGVGCEDSWSKTISTYLTNLLARAALLDADFKPFLTENLQRLESYFNAIPATLNAKKPVLTPVDLNLHNFVVGERFDLTYIDLESFWSADTLLAYGDFIGNTYNTPLGHAFIDQWGELEPTDTYLVHAYALLSNLSALVCIAESQSATLTGAKPWGNPNTYLSLIEAHKKKLFQQDSPLIQVDERIQHVSVRNAFSFYKPNLIGNESLHARISEITRSIRRFCNIEFDRDKENFYVLIYGSYAYGMAQASSDLDIVFVAENNASARRERITRFIIALHEKYGLRKDNEIPYEKKAVMTMAFVEKACAGEGIRRHNQWKFSPIVKEKEFLSSTGLLLRFTQGMLANPHLFIDGSHPIYAAHRTCATLNLIKAILCEHKITQTSAIGLLEKFCVNPQGSTGDFYLGFSYREPFKAYLGLHLESVLSSVKKSHAVGPNGAEYQFTTRELAEPSFVSEFTLSSQSHHDWHFR